MYCDVTPCCLVDTYLPLRGTSCLRVPAGSNTGRAAVDIHLYLVPASGIRMSSAFAALRVLVVVLMHGNSL